MSTQTQRKLRVFLASMLGLLLLLTGCAASLRLGKEDIPVEVPKTSQDVECRIYLRTSWTPMIALPDLRKEKDLTSEKLNIIQAQYIKQLRDSIAEERARMDEDYSRYVRRCLR